MVPELAFLLAVSSSTLPRIGKAPTPVQALLESCEREERGDVDGALLALRTANDAAEVTASTSIPPEH